MEMEVKMDNLDASFDIVARQDAADEAIARSSPARRANPAPRK